MTLNAERRLEVTREKLDLLERTFNEVKADSSGTAHTRELTLRSLKGLVNRLKEEIARHKAREKTPVAIVEHLDTMLVGNLPHGRRHEVLRKRAQRTHRRLDKTRRTNPPLHDNFPTSMIFKKGSRISSSNQVVAMMARRFLSTGSGRRTYGEVRFWRRALAQMAHRWHR